MVNLTGWSATAAIATVALLCPRPAAADSLKEAYDQASPANGYDRYIELEPGATYTGGLYIGKAFNRITAEFEGPCESVRIVGNGAILDLRGQQISMAYCPERFDIDDCVIVGGDVMFRGYNGDGFDLVPQGSVSYVTFYKPHDYGVRTQASGAGILIQRNIIVDAVDTGPDFLPLNGAPSSTLPTGASVSQSISYASVEIRENWSFHTSPWVNADPMRHFTILCDYG